MRGFEQEALRERICIRTHAQTIFERSLFTPCGDGEVSRTNVSAAAVFIRACDGAMGSHNTILRNQKAPTRRGGRKRNRHSLELSKSHKLSDADFIAIEVQAFLSDCLPSISDLFATRKVQVCE